MKNHVLFALTDLELVSNTLRGEISCFGVLYNRYYEKVVGQCLKLIKCKDLANDLSQDIFVKLYSQLSKFDFRAKFSTWLYTITNNYCIDYLRKSKKNMTVDLENTVKEIVDEVEDYELSHLDIDIHELLSTLSTEERQLLVWKYLEKLSIKEIQQKLEVKESTVKMRLKRAKEKIVKNFK